MSNGPSTVDIYFSFSEQGSSRWGDGAVDVGGGRKAVCSTSALQNQGQQSLPSLACGCEGHLGISIQKTGRERTQGTTQKRIVTRLSLPQGRVLLPTLVTSITWLHSTTRKAGKYGPLHSLQKREVPRVDLQLAVCHRLSLILLDSQLGGLTVRSDDTEGKTLTPKTRREDGFGHASVYLSVHGKCNIPKSTGSVHLNWPTSWVVFWVHRIWTGHPTDTRGWTPQGQTSAKGGVGSGR